MQSLFDVPPRVAESQRARQRFPEEFSLLVPALGRSDALADAAIASLAHLSPMQAHRIIMEATRRSDAIPRAEAPTGGHGEVPAALQRLVKECERTPSWVDWDRIDRAGELFFRAGVLGGITLGMCSLIYGYASPVGNKPLAFSGALENKAQRRLAETSQFVAAVCKPGGLHPGAPGFSYSIHVRLMHAQVRAMALRDRRWNREQWGLPINQHDMLATILLFSVVFVDGLRRLGLSTTVQEQEDYQALFRLVGFYLGVDQELLPQSIARARRQAEFIRLTQGAPDEDSRALVAALIREPLRRATTPLQLRAAQAHIAVTRLLARTLIDETTARALGLGRGGTEAVTIPLGVVMPILEAARKRIPRLDAFVRRSGQSYWDFSGRIRDANQGMFVIPRALMGTPRG